MKTPGLPIAKFATMAHTQSNHLAFGCALTYIIAHLGTTMTAATLKPSEEALEEQRAWDDLSSWMDEQLS
eukprot:scaffold128793_cov20-Cyclotella_meneghiniana.AAC.1